MAKQGDRVRGSLESLSGLSDATSRMMDVPVRVVHIKIQKAGGSQSVARPMSQGSEGGGPRTKREWTIGKMTLTDLAGDTVQVVRHIFGSPALREKEATDLQRKFAPGTLFRVSNIQKIPRAKPSEEAYSIPWTITYDGSSTVQFKSILQGDPAYSAIPSIMHPAMMIQPLSTLDDGRTVSVCGIVKQIVDHADTHSGKVVNFVLVGADNNAIACAAWKESAAAIHECVGKIVYLFHMWASFKDEGDGVGCVLRGLTTTESTIVIVPEEKMIHQKFQVLVMDKNRLMSAASSELVMMSASSNKTFRRDYSSEAAVVTCVSNLQAISKFPQENAASKLFLVEAGIGRVILKVGLPDLKLSDIQTKDGSRIWLDVLLQDLSGGAMCKMGEDVVLKLTGCSAPGDVVEYMKKGKMCFPLRSYKVLLTHSMVESQVYANLTIVHATAAPALPSTPPPEYTNPRGCMPAEIRQLSKDHFGNMVIGNMKKPVSSELVLVVLQGTQDAECEQRGNDVYVRNLNVKDVLSSDAGSFSVPVVTAVPLSSVPSMTLHTERKVIAYVTDVLMKSDHEVLEVHTSAMFTIGDLEVTFMKQFLLASLEFVKHYSGKRKRHSKDVNSEYVSSLEDPLVGDQK